MVSFRISICAAILAILASSGAFADEQRRGFTQPKAVVSGDKVFVMGEFRAAGQTGWPGRLLLQADTIGSGAASEFALPAVASHSLEGGQTRTCWSLEAGRIWVLVESDDATKERNYNVIRMDIDTLGAYAVKDSVMPPLSESPAHGIDRVEALPMQVQQGLRTQAMLDYHADESQLARRGFDIHAAGDDLAVLYLLVGSRMTVWCYSPAGYTNVGGRVVGPYRIDGPLLTAGGHWRQIATFDVPFQSQFRVFHNGGRACFWTVDGRLFECLGLDARPKVEFATSPIVEGGEAGYTPNPRSWARFLGTNDERVTVTRLGDLPGLSMLLEDTNTGKAYLQAESQVMPIAANAKPIALRESKGDGQGLIADAMDMVRAIVSGRKAVTEPNEPNMPPQRQARPKPEPAPVEEEKPSNIY